MVTPKTTGRAMGSIAGGLSTDVMIPYLLDIWDISGHFLDGLQVT